MGATTSTNWWPTGMTAFFRPKLATPGSLKATSTPNTDLRSSTTGSRSWATRASWRTRSMRLPPDEAGSPLLDLGGEGFTGVLGGEHPRMTFGLDADEGGEVHALGVEEVGLH